MQQCALILPEGSLRIMYGFSDLLLVAAVPLRHFVSSLRRHCGGGGGGTSNRRAADVIPYLFMHCI